MKKYEYRILENVSLYRLSGQINDHAEDGWRAVNITIGAEREYRDREYICLLEREVRFQP